MLTAETYIVTGFIPETGTTRHETITAPTRDDAEIWARRNLYDSPWHIIADHQPVQVRQYIVEAYSTCSDDVIDTLVWATNPEDAEAFTEDTLYQQIEDPDYWEIDTEEIHPPLKHFGHQPPNRLAA